MRYFIVFILFIFIVSCSPPTKKTAKNYPLPVLTNTQANRLAQLPIDCVETEFPNKLNQTLSSAEDLKTPKQLHPAFYGCFDWHSAVHGHWAMVSLLKQFPQIEKANEIKAILNKHLTAENIAIEVDYFKSKHNQTWERTYGWAWLLKLAQELHEWDNPFAKNLENNLQPLTDLIVTKFENFLPKLHYQIRVGEHANTAFGMAFAHDYAVSIGDFELQELIEQRAFDFYYRDANCPINWEPGGFDFLSPCLQEMDVMRKTLPASEFEFWVDKFLPQLSDKSYDLAVGVVSDRSDGKLVHLDGLNFSRAWSFYGIGNQFPKYKHLINIANKHMQYSLPYVVGDSYEGGHWLGSFAIYALNQSKNTHGSS
jgi:hypothetical protein